MSPELEKLLEAFHEKRTCPSSEKAQRDATFERLLNDAVASRPGTSRDSCWKRCNPVTRNFAALAANRRQFHREREGLHALFPAAPIADCKISPNIQRRES